MQCGLHTCSVVTSTAFFPVVLETMQSAVLQVNVRVFAKPAWSCRAGLCRLTTGEALKF